MTTRRLTTTLFRAVELTVAAVCAALALLKLFAPLPADAGEAVAATAVGVVEATLAAWLAVGSRPRHAASAVAAFGVALAVASMSARPPSRDVGCGCLGPFRAAQAHRLVVAGALVVLAGARLSARASVRFASSPAARAPPAA